MTILNKLKSRWGRWVVIVWIVTALFLLITNLLSGCTGHPCFPGAGAIVIAIFFIPITIVLYFLTKWLEELHGWLNK